MNERSAGRTTIGNLVELLLPLLILALLIGLCAQLLVPFVGLLVWTVILAICFYPLHKRITARGMSNRVSASIIGIALAALILVPTAIAAISAASSAPALVERLKSGEQQVPPPPSRLLDVPVIGRKAHALWTKAATDTPAFAWPIRRMRGSVNLPTSAAVASVEPSSTTTMRQSPCDCASTERIASAIQAAALKAGMTIPMRIRRC